MTPEKRQPRCLRRTVLNGIWMLLLCGALLPEEACAAPAEILVVTSEDGGAQAEIVEEIRKTLTTGWVETPTLRLLRAADVVQPEVSGKSSMIVTIGTEAAKAVMAAQPSVPVLSGFLPQSSYASLLAATPSTWRANSTALYVDQPLERQLRLIRMALPQYKRVGIVLGPDSRKLNSGLRRAAIVAGLTLETEVIDRENQLVRAIYRVLEDSDILFVIPDAVVFNRLTAQNVLTTAFRIGKPVAAYSRAYVNAGALLAVYSTPAQIGRQMGETLRLLFKQPLLRLSPPAYPTYFTVVTNERLARSYGLEIEPAEQLSRKLVATEDSR